MDFPDPLRNLALRPYPAPESVASSILSSTVSDIETYFEKSGEAKTVLDNYVATNNDDTAKVINAFLKHLPKEGQIVLLKEVLYFKDNGQKLRELRNFLIDAILKPSKSMSYFATFIYSWSLYEMPLVGTTKMYCQL